VPTVQKAGARGEPAVVGSPPSSDATAGQALSREARHVLGVVARRWSLPILDALHEGGVLRHHELRAAVGGVADKVLVETLRMLEDESLVSRTAYAEVPLRVEYRLTDTACRLRTSLLALNDWALREAGVDSHPDVGSGVTHTAAGSRSQKGSDQ
jgi:DNA-binding HxlR family transcriptional regulator